MSKKKNKSRLTATMADLNKAQRQIDRELQQLRDKSAMDATITVQAIYLEALHKEFSFAFDDFVRLQKAVDSISDRISDSRDEYTFDSLREDLKCAGVVL